MLPAILNEIDLEFKDFCAENDFKFEKYEDIIYQTPYSLIKDENDRTVIIDGKTQYRSKGISFAYQIVTAEENEDALDSISFDEWVNIMDFFKSIKAKVELEKNVEIEIMVRYKKVFIKYFFDQKSESMKYIKRR